MSGRRHAETYATWLLAFPVALLMLVLAVGTAAAHPPGHLSDPSVSVRQIQAGDAIALGITYTDAGGAAPRSVVAQVGDIRAAMTAGSGAFSTGVRYTVSITPAPGWQAVVIRATDSGGHDEDLWAGQILVKAPKPNPTPTLGPTATPKPEPTATPRPTPTQFQGTDGGTGTSGQNDGGSGLNAASPTPADNGGSSDVGASPAPAEATTPAPAEATTPAPAEATTPAPGAATTPAPEGATTPAPRAATTPVPRAATTPAPHPATTPAPHAATTAVPGAVTTSGGGAAATPDGADPQASTDLAADLGIGTGQQSDQAGGPSSTGNVAGGQVEETRGAIAVGARPVPADLLAPYRHTSLPQLLRELAPTIGTATAGGAAWAAFVLFGKRRRDGDESESGSLQAAAADAGVNMAAADGLAEVDESQLPRWRRPSLQQVRRTDPLRAVANEPHLSFESAGVRPLESYERREIRYRLVRLLDGPDEVRASEIGILDRGDEVQLLERRGVYWRILCPDGRAGWIHRMTLGNPASEAEEEASTHSQAAYEAPFVAELDAANGRPPASKTESEMAAASQDEASDGLLEAYMRARSGLRQGEAVAQEALAAQADPVVSRPRRRAKTRPAAPTAAPAVSRARDCLEKAGFAVQGPKPPTEPTVGKEPAVERASDQVVNLSSDLPASDASLAAEPERVGDKCSERKTAGSRKASSGTRPGTRSRRPSR